MNVAIIYHIKSDHARLVEEFAHNYERQNGNKIDLVSLETPDGAGLARLYDIVRYPAIIVTRDNGELVTNWQGTDLPLMNEVAAYQV